MQWLALQQEVPQDYDCHWKDGCRYFIELSAKAPGWNKKNSDKYIIWEGSGLNEVGRRADNNQINVRIDSRYFRPTEVEQLLGDPTKAFKKLN